MLESAEQAMDRGWMPAAAARGADAARVQFHRKGFGRDDPRRFQLPNDRSQCLRPNERCPLARRAGARRAGSAFDHSQSRHHADDSGVVPAAVALRRHAPPVQFIGDCAAGNDTARLQFPNRGGEGHRNGALLFHDPLGGPPHRSHGARVIGRAGTDRWLCVISAFLRSACSVARGSPALECSSRSGTYRARKCLQ